MLGIRKLSPWYMMLEPDKSNDDRIWPKVGWGQDLLDFDLTSI